MTSNAIRVSKPMSPSYNEALNVPSTQSNPLASMNPKQAELAFLKHLKAIGISNEKLIKTTMASVKPSTPDASVKTPVAYFSLVMQNLVRAIAKQNLDLKEFSIAMVKAWLKTVDPGRPSMPGGDDHMDIDAAPFNAAEDLVSIDEMEVGKNEGSPTKVSTQMVSNQEYYATAGITSPMSKKPLHRDKSKSVTKIMTNSKSQSRIKSELLDQE